MRARDVIAFQQARKILKIAVADRFLSATHAEFTVNVSLSLVTDDDVSRFIYISGQFLMISMLLMIIPLIRVVACASF